MVLNIFFTLILLKKSSKDLFWPYCAVNSIHYDWKIIIHCNSLNWHVSFLNCTTVTWLVCLGNHVMKSATKCLVTERGDIFSSQIPSPPRIKPVGIISNYYSHNAWLMCINANQSIILFIHLITCKWICWYCILVHLQIFTIIPRAQMGSESTPWGQRPNGLLTQRP